MKELNTFCALHLFGCPILNPLNSSSNHVYHFAFSAAAALGNLVSDLAGLG